jgi:hypothetical protein
LADMTTFGNPSIGTCCLMRQRIAIDSYFGLRPISG